MKWKEWDKRRINIVGVVVLAVGVTVVGVMLSGVLWRSDDDVVVEDVRRGDVDDCAKQPPIADLSRERALEIIEEAFTKKDEMYVHTLCDFVPKDVWGGRAFADFKIEIADLNNFNPIHFAENKSGMNVLVSPATDELDSRYFVITGRQASPIEGMMNDVWERTVVFDENELKYDETGFVFLKKEPQFVEDVSRIWVYSSAGKTSRFTGKSLYAYAMKTVGNIYEFTYSYVGLDFTELFKGKGQINIVEQTWGIDKETGGMAKNGPIGVEVVLKTYKLTDDEFAKIRQLMDDF